MTLYSLLILLHILAAMVWVGGSVVLNLLGTRARSSADPAARIQFVQSLSYVGPRVLAPSVVVVVVVGLWMVLASEAWDFPQPWVLAGIALFVAALLVGGLYLGRIGIRLTEATGAGNDSPESRRLLDQWILGSRLVLLLLLLAVVDMVFKPGL
jgi:uncharacterized membrane protein